MSKSIDDLDDKLADNAHSLAEVIAMPSDKFVALIDSKLEALPGRKNAALDKVEAERVRIQRNFRRNNQASKRATTERDL